MAEPFVMVYQRMFRDDEYLALSTDARLLFVWLWANPSANKIGLYTATWLAMSDALGKPTDSLWKNDRERLEAALGELAAKPLALYDPERMLVWVCSRAKHANRSETAWHGMQREYAQVEDCELRQLFAERYGGMLKLATP